MTRPLYQLGSFQFDLPNGVPQTLDWQAEYRWEEQGRLMRDPAQQFIGPGSQAITLDGVLFPGFSGRQNTMEQLRTIAREGQPLMLSDGLGKVYGKWAIKSLREGKGVFAPGGGARQIDFNIQLVFYGEDNPGEAASPLSVDLANSYASSTGINMPGISYTDPASAFGALNWSQASQWQGLTQQATTAGFSLGQLATLATTATGAAATLARGDYVNAALGTFGLFGFNSAQATGWAQVGISATGLAQAYVTGQGPTGMSLALGAATLAGGQTMKDLGLIKPGEEAAINSLLKSTATLGTILEVDPKVTNSLRNSIVLP